MFPARAGMNRLQKIYQRLGRYVPRTGGDEPDKVQRCVKESICSPHGRG